MAEMTEVGGESHLVGVIRAELEVWAAKADLQLPVLPEATGLLLAAANDEDAKIQDLYDIVQRDPSLAAHVLRVANSPWYATRYPILSLKQAVTRIGLKELRWLALVMACNTKVFRVNGWESEVAVLFTHSLTTALYASEIAKKCRLNEEEAFVSALLHDVGHAVVLQRLVDVQARLRYELPRPIVLSLADQHHTTVGSRLAIQWGLSRRLADVIGLHHGDPTTLQLDLALVQVADQLADGIPETVATLADSRAVKALGLLPDYVGKLADDRRRTMALAEALL